MKLIIGIGNPDVKYKNTRHNVGLMVVDELVSVKVGPSKSASKGPTFITKRSDKFMNDSGSFVKKQLSKYPSILVSNLFVVHDDLDIPLGAFKIQFGTGPKVHNGLNDIYEKLGTSDFWHVRVGVDARDSENRTKGDEYVLSDFTEEEKVILNRVIKQICNQLAV